MATRWAASVDAAKKPATAVPGSFKRKTGSRWLPMCTSTEGPVSRGTRSRRSTSQMASGGVRPNLAKTSGSVAPGRVSS